MSGDSRGEGEGRRLEDLPDRVEPGGEHLADLGVLGLQSGRVVAAVCRDDALLAADHVARIAVLVQVLRHQGSA